MKTTSFVTAAALLSSSYAATVTLETTRCLDSNVPLQQLEIEMNLSGPVARDLPQVCGLRILSASDGVDVNSIKCQAFKDVVGTEPGSAIFTYAQPALIATNPVQEKAIWCTYPTDSHKFRRQANDTAASSSSSSSSSSSQASSSAGSTLVSTITSSASSSASSGSPSTITSTTVVSPSSGIPSPSGNLTTPSTSLRPSASQTSQPTQNTPGAASSVGVGMGVVAAALAAMFL